MRDPELNAWCDYPSVDVPKASNGPLSGLTLAVKDIFQVAGYPNGWGQPTRLAEAEIDTETQPVVQKMLDAGIECAGKSQCEELCYSLMGNNAHYGMPYNSAAPDRLTGGSSSGSASLIAAGAVDVATASDTAGSVRAPASFCGLIGLRATHGRISLEKTMGLAPSFDCLGWFAKDIATYKKVADVVLDEDEDQTPLDRLLFVPLLDQQVTGDEEAQAYRSGLSKIEAQFEARDSIETLPFTLDQVVDTFVTCQSYDVWATLGDWVTTRKPDLGPGIKERFAFGASVTDAQFSAANSERQRITKSLIDLVGPNGVIVLPTVPSCAPLRTDTQDQLQTFRLQMLKLLSPAGVSGMPQITLPLAEVHGAPFGISLLGPRGSDKRLIDLATKILS